MWRGVRVDENCVLSYLIKTEDKKRLGLWADDGEGWWKTKLSGVPQTNHLCCQGIFCLRFCDLLCLDCVVLVLDDSALHFFPDLLFLILEILCSWSSVCSLEARLFSTRDCSWFSQTKNPGTWARFRQPGTVIPVPCTLFRVWWSRMFLWRSNGAAMLVPDRTEIRK